MRRKPLLLGLAAATAVFLALPATAASADRKLDAAAISRELSAHPNDPAMNFLSALAYESQSTASTEARELARVGYLMALRQDGGFWRAAYQLGLMALEDRDPIAAQRFLLTAVLNAPNEARLYSALARAAYCAGDIEAASAALAKAQTLHLVGNEDDLLTTVLIALEQGDRAGVDALLSRLSPQLREAILNRLAAPPPQVLASPKGAEASNEIQANTTRMALVDLVIIRRDEASGTQSGINLLDALSLQLGGDLINRTWAKSTDLTNPENSTSTTSSNQSSLLTIPAVTYSLALANAFGNTSRIEARPTLLIYDGSEATMFDGGTLTFATDGDLSSSSETREVGLSLSVKPKFIGNDTVNLAVQTTMEDFVQSEAVGSFRQSVQTDKSSTKVAADLRFGQTMLISAGSSSMVLNGRSKTPILGDIPVLGKLFSEKNKVDKTSELIVLLSLRRPPGQASSGDGSEELKLISVLRQRLFPSLDEISRRPFETRPMFYRIENPARVMDQSYISPVVSEATLNQVTAAVR